MCRIDVAVLVNAPVVGSAVSHGDEADRAGGIGADIQGIGIIAVLGQRFSQFSQVVQGLDFLVETDFLGDIGAVVGTAAGIVAGTVDTVYAAVHGDVVVNLAVAQGQVRIVFRVGDVVGQIPESAGAGGVHDQRAARVGRGDQHRQVLVRHGGIQDITIVFVRSPGDLEANAGCFLDRFQDGVILRHKIHVHREFRQQHGNHKGFIRGGEAHHAEGKQQRQENRDQFLHGYFLLNK